MPLLFSPAEIGEDRYVDGATWSSTNADLLLPDPPRLAVVVAPMARRGRGIGLALARRRARRELVALTARGTEVVAVRPGPDSAPLFGLSARGRPDLGERLVDLGRRMVGDALRRRGLA